MGLIPRYSPVILGIAMSAQYSRVDSFKRKFAGASQLLDAKPEQIVSLKLREPVNSYQVYHDLVRDLEHDAGLQCTEVDRAVDLQGQGYLLSDGKSQVIVVEHETGLEILYIAGSIASLISVVPMILQAWSWLRGRFMPRHGPGPHEIEMRRLDADGHLEEHPMDPRAVGGMGFWGAMGSAFATSASLIETELKNLTGQVQLLTARVESLEKASGTKPPPRRKTRRSAKKSRV